MATTERVEKYRELEKFRGRPLLVYVTGSSPGRSGAMALDSIPVFLDQLEAIPSDVEALDLLLVSLGGDPTVAWRIVSLIRERVQHFSVLIPEGAFSAATLIALGADEIVMHANGNLGPVDPQIKVARPQGDQQPQLEFGSEDLTAFLQFAKRTVGLSDQRELAKVFELVCESVGPVPIGVAARGAQLSLAMGEKLLRMHMKGDQAQKAPIIAEELNKNFFHHGYPVSRSEAIEIGLKIADRDIDLEAQLWSTWKCIEDSLELRKAFSPIECLRLDENCNALFDSVPVANIPADLPQQLQQEVYGQVLSGVEVQRVPPVKYHTVHAIIESPRMQNHFTTEGLVFGTRRPDLQIMYNNVVIRSGWAAVSPSADDVDGE